MSKLTKKKFISYDMSDLMNMDKAELREVLRGARQLFNAQEIVFNKNKDKAFSFALDKMQDFYDKNGKKPPSRMSHKAAQKEVARLYEFFNSETSTLPGTYRVMIEQDKRIFGEDEKTGKPLKRLTLSERTDFWAAYKEFINLEKESYVRNMGSNTIQQELAQMVIRNRKSNDEFIFGMGDFKHLKTVLEERKKSEEWEMSSYGDFDNDVLSGKRPY